MNEKSCLSSYNSELKKKVYFHSDSLPEFPGGNSALLQYIAKKIVVDENEEYQGYVNLEFIILEDGTVWKAWIDDKKEENYSSIEKQVVQIALNFPKWKPGECGHKTVPFKISWPLRL